MEFHCVIEDLSDRRIEQELRLLIREFDPTSARPAALDVSQTIADKKSLDWVISGKAILHSGTIAPTPFAQELKNEL